MEGFIREMVCQRFCPMYLADYLFHENEIAELEDHVLLQRGLTVE